MGASSAFCGFLIRYFVTAIFFYQTTYVIRLLFTRIQMQIQSGTMFSERRASSRQRRRKSQRKTSSIYWRRPSKIKHLVCSPLLGKTQRHKTQVLCPFFFLSFMAKSVHHYSEDPFKAEELLDPSFKQTLIISVSQLVACDDG